MSDYREYDDDVVHDMWVDYTDHEYTGELRDWYGDTDVYDDVNDYGYDDDDDDVNDYDVEDNVDRGYMQHPPSGGTVDISQKDKTDGQDPITQLIEREKTINSRVIWGCFFAIIIAMAVLTIVY